MHFNKILFYFASLPVKSRLRHDGVAVAVLLLRLVTDGPVVLVLEVTHHLQTSLHQGTNTSSNNLPHLTKIFSNMTQKYLAL